MTDINDAVSIDFGHTRTKMAFYNPNTEQIELMTWGENSKPYTPSVFASEKNSGKIIVGEEAERIIEHDLKLKTTSRKWNPILDFKRDLGRYQKRLSKLLGVDPSKTNPSEHLMTVFLTELCEKARKHPVFVGRKPPTTVYLTYTPRYDSDQIAILMTSAKNAGFETIEVVAEPLAAAQMFQAMGAKTTDDIVILDCGGWTLDFSYLHRSEDDSNPYNIEITDCKTIGGRDVDAELLKVVKRKSNNSNQVAADRIFFRRQVRRCKEEYCDYPESWDSLRHQISVLRGQTVVLTKDDIQPIIDTQVERIGEAVKPHIERIKAELKDKGREEPVIHLVGGSSRLPGLKIHLENSFGLTVFESMPETEYAPVRGPLKILATEKKEDKHDTPSITTEKKEDKHDTPSIRKKKKDTTDNPTVTYTESGQAIIDHPNAVSSVAISPDSKHLATVTGSTVYLWDVSAEIDVSAKRTRKPVLLEGPFVDAAYVLDAGYAVTSVAFSSDSMFLAVAAENSIQLHELKTRRSAELTEHTDFITSIAFAPDGPFLVSGSRDKTIKLWDVVEKKNKQTLSRHKGWVNWVSWSSDGGHIASAGQDGTVQLHLPWVDKEESVWRRHSAPVTWVGFIKHGHFGKFWLSKDTDNLFKMWRIGTTEHPHYSWKLRDEFTSIITNDLADDIDRPYFDFNHFIVATKDRKLCRMTIDSSFMRAVFLNKRLYWKPHWRKLFAETKFRGIKKYDLLEIPAEMINNEAITSLSMSPQYLAFAATNRTFIQDLGYFL